jgi:hypothetical protein
MFLGPLEQAETLNTAEFWEFWFLEKLWRLYF